MRRVLAVIAGILILLFVEQSSAESLFGRAVAIADGDTLTVVDQSNVRHRIRLK